MKRKNKKQSNIDFKVMAFFFTIRDKFHPPMNKIRKAKVRQGEVVLDYGCGSGSYTIAAAEKVGPNGKIIAADIHPLALEKVKKKAENGGYSNINTVQTDCVTGLNEESVDKIICFDVLHGVTSKEDILEEFHRVLKPHSMLSFDDHHMNEEEIIDLITSAGLFKLVEKMDNQYNFVKA
ncbi:MAG: class I SAM-dependent methyltransferase [Promethearchaeota archaeon]